MKIFTLICSNAAHEIVSVENFTSFDDACKRMNNDFNDEVENMNSLYEEYVESHCYSDTAYVLNYSEDDGYWWSIIETEVELKND